MLPTNIFLKILNKEIPATILHEDEHCIAFRDIAPAAPTHVLIIPRKVIRTHAELSADDAVILGRMHIVAVKLAAQLNLMDGYRLVVNCDEAGGQTVPHLHMHLLGGRNLGWPPG
ncbi:MAG: histidine triad nucleotide-binding protein [Gemmataceae bacterium]